MRNHALSTVLREHSPEITAGVTAIGVFAVMLALGLSIGWASLLGVVVATAAHSIVLGRLLRRPPAREAPSSLHGPPPQR